MDEKEILSCKVTENIWKCPIESCEKLLSRKQTLKSHIVNQHDIQAGHKPKRYKVYTENETQPIPKTSKWRLSKSSSLDMDLQEQEHIPNDIIYHQMSDLDTDSDVEEDEEEVSSEISSDSDNDCDQQPSLAVEDVARDPPLYVIPPSASIYESDISRTEHLLSVGAFVTRHNLSDIATTDLMRLLQLHIPGHNIGEGSANSLKHSLGFDSDYLEYHLFCEICKKLSDTQSDNCETPGCDGKRKNYFVTGKLGVQLKEILERDGIWQAIEEMRGCESSSICDITCGSEYKKMKESGEFLDGTTNLTLSLFIDGIPLFKSSSTSLWPVYLLINEIPPKERFSKKNMVLWGVWQGIGKPKMNMFMKPLVLDLIEVYQTGIEFMCPRTQASICSKCKLIVATMDLQARAYVVNMTQHNGMNGCLYCMEPGVVVPSGKGHCRSYPARDMIPRTEEQLRADAEQARLQGTKINGVMGMSVLWFLPYFSFTQNIVVDYMHGTLLGVTKKLLELWFDTTGSTTYNLSRELKGVDEDLKNIKPPTTVHRLPRVITKTYTNWKASELRNWLLFYSLPCLLGRLPEVYLIHFSLLVEAIYILLQEGILESELVRAEAILATFVKNVEVLYGGRIMSLNVHNLLHMTKFVREYGPLWAWSCFCFESFNGEIKKGVHGTGNVCKQIFWKLQAQKRVEIETRKLPVESDVRQFAEGLQGSTKLKREDASYQCKVFNPKPLKFDVTNSVKTQLRRFVGEIAVDLFHFESCKKIERNGFLMYSRQCSKVKKHNSYTILLERKLPDEEIIAVEVDLYLREKQSKKVFALSRCVKSGGPIITRRVPHLQKLCFQGNLYETVVPAEYLQEPLMVIHTKRDVFSSVMPNKVERD